MDIKGKSTYHNGNNWYAHHSFLMRELLCYYNDCPVGQSSICHQKRRTDFDSQLIFEMDEDIILNVPVP